MLNPEPALCVRLVFFYYLYSVRFVHIKFSWLVNSLPVQLVSLKVLNATFSPSRDVVLRATAVCGYINEGGRYDSYDGYTSDNSRESTTREPQPLCLYFILFLPVLQLYTLYACSSDSVVLKRFQPTSNTGIRQRSLTYQLIKNLSYKVNYFELFNLTN